MGLGEMFRGIHGAAFMPYICCGDPSARFTMKLAETLVENGADAIELGIPFSDPVADGRVLQQASSRALSAGMTPKKALRLVASMRRRGISIPIIIMSYCNTFYSQGAARMLAQAKKAGADAVIVPDLPLEESQGFRKECRKAGLDFVPLTAPGCSEGRIRRIAKGAGGFLYAVSVSGTTGARKKVATEALSLVARARRSSGMPVAAGFGIATPGHARQFARSGASGIIVGSRIAEIYSKSIKEGEKKALEEIAGYCRAMKSACARTK
jgi:tryptophan synthase alpha chain